MAVIEKRGRRWRARVRVAGSDKSRSFTTRAQAAQWALEQEADPAIYGRHTLRKALERYRDEVSPHKRGKRWEQVRIDHFLQALNFLDDPVDDITPEPIGQWRDKRLREVSAGTVLRDLTLLSAVFEAARREWKWCRVNPVKDVRKPSQPPHRERLISDAERDTIVGRLGWHGGKPERPGHEVAIAFLLALETGMRSGEVLTARPDLKHRTARLPMTKNGTARDVPLSTRAVELYKLIPSGFTVDDASRDVLFRKARDAAQIDVQFHDARHTAATRLAKVLSPLELARMLGHKNLKSVMIYYNEPASEIAKRLG